MASLNDLLAAPGFKDLNPAERRASIQKVAPNLPDLNDDEIEHIRQRVVASRAAGPQPISIPMYNRGGVIKEAGGPASTLENVATYPLRLVSGGAEQLGQGMSQAANPQSGSDFAGGASNIIRGAMGMASPFAIPYGLATAPVTTIMGTGAGLGAGAGAEELSRMMGVPEGYAEAIGTGTGLGAGAVAGGIPYLASSALRAGRNLLPYLQNSPTAARVVGHSLTDLLPIPGLLHPLVHAGVERMLSTEAKPTVVAKPTAPASAVGSAPLGSTGLAVTPPPIPAVPPSAIGGALIGSTGAGVHPIPTLNLPTFPFGGSTGDVGFQAPAPVATPTSAVGSGPFGGATGDVLHQMPVATGVPSAVGGARLGTTGARAVPVKTPAPVATPRSAVGGAPFGTSGTAGGPVGELQSGTPLGTWYGGIPEPGVPQKGTPVNPVDKLDRTALNATLHREAQDLDIAPVGGLRGAGPNVKVPSGFMDVVAKDKFGKPYRELSDDQLRQMINDRTLHNYKVK